MRASERFEIEILLTGVRDVIPTARWSWDDARQTVSVRLGSDDEKRVRKQLDRTFLFSCRKKRKTGSSPVAGLILQMHGSLRDGQQLWLSDPGCASGTYALSKPWADGENLTLVLGVWSGEDQSDRVLISSIRKIFGVH